MERDHAAAFIGVTVGELAGVVIPLFPFLFPEHLT